jgi:hypothetical protein
MARILIEEYRKWEIFFDTDKEEFYTVSNEYDRDNTKKSYAATKKFIDDYIKDNYKFQPIKVQNHPTIYGEARVITLIGIRKDGLFMCEENGKKIQFSKYDENSYFLVNSDNDVIFEEINKLVIERNLIDKKVKEFQDKVIVFTVADYKKTLEIDKV